MRSTFLVTICATAALAVPDLALFQRDVNALLPRETKVSGALSNKCQSVLSEVVSALPTPPAQLASAESKLTQSITDPCSPVPSSLSSAYSVYTSKLFSWYSSHSREVDAAFKVCTDLKSTAADFLKVCSTASNLPTALRASATSTSDSTASSGTGSSSSSSSSSTSTGAAPRETGMAMAAGAAAFGLLAAAL